MKAKGRHRFDLRQVQPQPAHRLAARIAGLGHQGDSPPQLILLLLDACLAGEDIRRKLAIHCMRVA